MATVPMTIRARVVVAAAIIAGFVAVVYGNSLSGAFLFDDLVHIVNNERIRDGVSLTHLLSDKRPVVDASLALNFRVGGLHVQGYHVINVIIHILTAFTLFGLLRRTLECIPERRQSENANLWIAASAALLWSVHPLQTQSVTYVIQRAESMMALFYLLTLYAAIRGMTSRHTTFWLVASIISCALGMGCKAVMVTAPIVVLLYDRTFIGRSFAAAMKKRGLFYLGLAATWYVLWACGIAGGVLRSSTRGAHVGFGFTGIAPFNYLTTQVGVLLTYLKLSIWPMPLCLDYNWPITTKFMNYAIPGILIVLLLTLIVWGMARRSAASFAMLSFFVILAPTSSIIPIKDTLFEHRMYLPLAAIIVLVVIGIHRLSIGICTAMGVTHVAAQRLFVTIVIVGAVVLGAGATVRNRAYAHPITMWQDVVSKRPTNARAYEHLGREWASQNRKDLALQYYAQAVKLDSESVPARVGLANALLETGHPDQAIPHFREAVRLSPTHVQAYVNLGYALQQTGDADGALAAFRTATEIPVNRKNAKKLANANCALGTALARRGRFEEAAPAFRHATKLWSGYQKAYYSLGLVYRELQQWDEAADSFQQSLQLNPSDEKARQQLEQVSAIRHQLESGDP